MPSNDSLDLELIDKQLQALLLLQLADGDDGTSDFVFDSLEEIRATYDQAKENAKTDPDAKKICESIAKSFPDILKGVLSASKAFQKGDVMNGSAAVMDICAAATTMISGILAAVPMLSLAGPVGALVGAVFGMVGQILAFFGPKQESLIDQIEKLLLELDADAELTGIKTTHDQIIHFSRSLKAGVRRLTARQRNAASPNGKPRLPSLIEKPLMTSEDATKLLAALGAVVIEMSDFKMVDGVTINGFLHTKNWLDLPSRQDLEKWPEVLSVWCKCYSELMSAQMAYYGIRHSSQLQKRLNEVENPLPGSTLLPFDQNQVRLMLRNMESLEYARQDQTRACNDTSLGFLRKTKPVAQNRGTFAIAYLDGIMYLASSKDILEQNKFVQFYEHCHNMVITPPPLGANNPKAPYDAWLADYAWVARNIIHSGLLVSKRQMSNPPGGEITFAPDAEERHQFGDGRPYSRFTDWCPVPVPGAANKYTLYATLNQRDGGALESWAWDSETRTFARNPFKRFWGLPMTQVRGTAKAALVAKDPDRTEEIDKIVQSGPIIYVAVNQSRDIFVVAANDTLLGTVPIPMGAYTGVAVDPEYVWMYGRDGFCCATHASVVSCLKQKRPMPWWVGNGQKKNLMHVTDLSPCEDGTLLVSVPDKLVMSEYRVDLATPGIGEGERVIIEDWKTLGGGGGASKVQKLPIFGWPLLASLMSDLAPKPASSELASALHEAH